MIRFTAPSSRSVRALVGLNACLLVVTACAGAPAEGEGEGEGEQEPRCTEPTAVTCRDDSFVDLAMSDDVTPGLVTDEETGPFLSHVDSTAGGFQGDGGYVYARFTDDGLVKVDLDDDASFDSMDWDIAFRRFVIRVNSGVSGPSCVGVARSPSTNFGNITSAAGLSFEQEQYYSDACDFVPDGSGLPSAPGTLLQNYWEYASGGCLAMTDNVYVLALADGRHVKLQVASYYLPAQQVSCNEDGELLDGESGSANLRVRWEFLE